MEKKFLEVKRTARFFQFGNKVNPENIWLVLHGYGQQAKYFVPKVKVLDDGKNLVVVAEGLNRFYLQGYNGRVGATWMTKDDREKDIEDNNEYLNQLLASTLNGVDGSPKINVLAFSQGIATLCRWIAQTDLQIDLAVFWAGSLPPDLNWDQFQNKFQAIDIHYVFGREDEFFNADKIEDNRKLLREVDIDHQLITFEGKHQMNDEVLQSILG